MNFKKLMTRPLDRGQIISGKFYPKGTKMIRGAKCPDCGTIHPGTNRIHVCGCGYKAKKQMSSSELRKFIKKEKAKQYEAKQAAKIAGRSTASEAK